MVPQPTHHSTIILLDSSSGIEEINDLIQQHNAVVITFDYESHKTLSRNNIAHEISDSYVDDNDLKIIQKYSYSLVKWYKESLIVNLIEYEGVNLGKLFEAELHYTLVPFLKKFVEVTKILEKYPTNFFLCSSTLHTIVKTFTNSNVITQNKKIIPQKFLYDSIKIHIKIGHRFFSLRIPRSYYLKAKKTSELLVYLLFRPKNRLHQNKKSILLVEFDTIKFRKIFSLSSKFPLDIILFDRRRPAIWNLMSFSIIKKSNCAIATYYDVNNSNMQNSIKEGISIIKEKTNSLWSKHDFFQSFFSISGFSFWESFKPIFIELYEKRSLEAISEIEITKRILTKYSPASILVWSEMGFNEQITIYVAKQLKIPIILIQHAGIVWDTSKACELNELSGIFPIESNKLVTWGETMKKCAIHCGIHPEKIEILGSVIYDEILENKNSGIKLTNDYILLATSSPLNNMVNDLTIKTNENYELAIRKVCQIALKMNKKLIIKLHPFQNELDITNLVKEIDPKIMVVKKGDIISLIKHCEILIVTDISSVILEAQIFEKPVISISIKDYGFGEPEVFTSNSCICTTTDDFEKVLNYTLNNIEFRKNIITKGNRFVENSLSNRGTATETLFSFLKIFTKT